MTAIHVRLRVGKEAYALPVEHVLEVVQLGELAALPGSPPEVLGVRNLRGQILPVIDLASVLGIAREGAPARMLVAEQGGRRAGFAIDEVSDVGSLPDPDEETDSEFLLGATLDGDELVGIVDVVRLFDVLEAKR
jgi:purine-binding chemotaxis protein CheW